MGTGSDWNISLPVKCSVVIPFSLSPLDANRHVGVGGWCDLVC